MVLRGLGVFVDVCNSFLLYLLSVADVETEFFQVKGFASICIKGNKKSFEALLIKFLIKLTLFSSLITLNCFKVIDKLIEVNRVTTISIHLFEQDFWIRLLVVL